MAPLRGWGPKGKRLRGFAPHGHWRTLTFLAALRCDRIDAPCVYSPDLNPIEQLFAKLKTLLRKAARRTVEATWKQIGALLGAFSPQECANYFRNSGYASK